jgi:hypothetical protein
VLNDIRIDAVDLKAFLAEARRGSMP